MARFDLCCIFFCLLPLFAHAAVVGYVPNAACASASGCDFNSDIWNITGVPSAQDTVSIYSNEPITINFRNSNFVLKTLIAGYGESSNITLALYNSVLNISSNTTRPTNSLVWNYHLQVHNSLVVVSAPGYTSGERLTSIGGTILTNDLSATLLVITNSTLNITKVSVSSMTATNSYFYGKKTWSIDTVQVANSSIDIYFLDVQSISAIDTFMYYQSILEVAESATISRGDLSGHIILNAFVSANLTDVSTDISVECSGNNSRLSIVASDPTTTQYLLRSVRCPSSYGHVVSIGDRTIVNVTSAGSIGDLTMGKQVTMNLRSFRYPMDVGIANQDSITEINVLPSIVKINVQQQKLLANINIRPTSTLTVENDLVVSGGITGDGEIDIGDATLTCDHIAVNTVSVFLKSQIVTNQFNVSNLFLHSSLLVNASTFISNPRIILSIYFLSINGNFMQTGGLIDINGEAGPFITVNGSVSLTDVAFELSSFIIAEQNYTLVRSLTGSILVHNCSYVAYGSLITQRLAIVVGGDLILLSAKSSYASGVSQLSFGWAMTFVLLFFIS